MSKFRKQVEHVDVNSRSLIYIRLGVQEGVLFNETLKKPQVFALLT